MPKTLKEEYAKKVSHSKNNITNVKKQNKVCSFYVGAFFLILENSVKFCAAKPIIVNHLCFSKFCVSRNKNFYVAANIFSFSGTFILCLTTFSSKFAKISRNTKSKFTRFCETKINFIRCKIKQSKFSSTFLKISTWMIILFF